MRLMRIVQERRLVQVLVTYLAAGWVGLEVIGSFVERQVLPEFVYPVGLVWYLTGIPVALLVGWYHGEQGHQKAPPWEVAAIAVVVLSLVGFSAVEVREHVTQKPSPSADAAEGRLDPRRIAVSYFDATEDSLRPVADALAEDLMRTLATVQTLDVVSVSAVLPFLGNATPPDSMARALGAGSVITGTLRAEPEGVRLEIRLIDGASGAEYGTLTLVRDWDELEEGAPVLLEELNVFLRTRVGDAVRDRASAQEAATRGG
jgi:TolB-like protein